MKPERITQLQGKFPDRQVSDDDLLMAIALGEVTSLYPWEFKALRRLLRLTQRELATQLDLNIVTIGRFEAGRGPIGRTAVLAMCYLITKG